MSAPTRSRPTETPAVPIQSHRRRNLWENVLGVACVLGLFVAIACLFDGGGYEAPPASAWESLDRTIRSTQRDATRMLVLCSGVLVSVLSAAALAICNEVRGD